MKENNNKQKLSEEHPERHDTRIFIDLNETMIRRNRRDPTDLLELGGPIHMSRTFPASIKRFTPKKLLKYVVLIVLGVALHSIYKEIFKVHQVENLNSGADNQGINKQVKLPDDKTQADPPKSRILDGDKVIDKKLSEQKLKELSQKVFEEERKKQMEREKLRKEQQEFAAKQAKLNEEKKKMTATQHQLLAEHNLNKAADKQQNQPNPEKNTKDKDINNGADHQNKESKSDTQLHQNERKKDHLITKQNIANDPKKDEKTQAEDNIQKQIANIIEKTLQENKNISAEKQKTAVHISNKEEVLLPKEIDVPNSFINAAKNYGGVDVRPIIRPNDEKMPPLVTGATKKTFMKVRQLVMTVQNEMPNEKIYIFDIDLTEHQHIMLAAMCNVEMRLLHLNLFPDFVLNTDIPYWRPIVMQIALTEFDHITWLNPDYHLTSDRLKKWYVHSSETGIFVIGQLLGHTISAVTHENMYKYIPTDKSRIKDAMFVDILALFIHNTVEVKENFMKILMACVMEPDCFAPKNVNRECDYDVTGRQSAGCHLNDESAMNIILNNWFDFQRLKFYSGNCCFKGYDKELNYLEPKMCGVHPNHQVGDEL